MPALSNPDPSLSHTGDRYWRVRGNAVYPGYPKPLRDFGFPTYVGKVDAAIHVSLVGRTFFFAGDKYWM